MFRYATTIRIERDKIHLVLKTQISRDRAIKGEVFERNRCIAHTLLTYREGP